MKKSKLILALAVVLALASVLSACGVKTAKFEDVYANGTYTDETTSYTKAEVVNIAGDMIGYSGDFVTFKEDVADSTNDIYRIYNLVSGAVVCTVTETDTLKWSSFSAVSINEGFALTVITKDLTNTWKTTYKTTLYKADGTQLASVDKQATATFNSGADLLVFNNTYYPVDADGNIGEGFAYSATAKMPEFHYASANYYYGYAKISDTAYDYRTLYVYDKQFKLIAEYQAPGYAECYEDYFFVLDNGNVIMQYIIYETWDAEEYDILVDGDKATLVTQLINIEKDTVKDIDLDYILAGVTTKTDFLAYGYDCFNEEIENIATALEIVDGRVNENERQAVMLSMTNKGKVEMVLNELFKAQGTAVPYLIAENRFSFRDATGAQYIANEKGEILARVDNVASKNEAYFVADGKIFNFDGTVVLDLEKDGYTISRTLDRSFILTKVVEAGTETYVFANGTATKLIGADETGKTYVNVSGLNNRCFAIKNVTADGTSYTYYNDLGASFLTVADTALSFEAAADMQNVVLFSYYDAANSKYVYYRFA